MRAGRSRWAVAILLMAACAQALAGEVQAPGDAGRVVLPGAVIPLRYDIELRPDAALATFAASVRVRLRIERATSTLTLNAADLSIDHVALSGRPEAPGVSLDAGRQQVSFEFAAPLRPGAYTLSIDYHGRINPQPAGLFTLDYASTQGRQRALYTQLEPADARRVLPCWDEPGRKAVFALSAVVPSALMAVSNMPVASREPLANGLSRVRFAPTPKMSSYLLFFALGDFERAHRRMGAVDIGVVVKRGDQARAEFALDAAMKILPVYNDYFGVPYPLPKLDLVAAPGGSQSFGAMENWGAILLFDELVLLDPQVSTEGSRRHAFYSIAHEIAHQWFGNLVTMDWWDDLWLNEGFATWMGLEATDRLHPEWKVWLGAQAYKRMAMTEDARDGSHAIVSAVRDAQQAGDVFDEITYAKGAAVIRMIQAFVGADAFRAGVRTYIKRHAYANTVSDDLWREIERASSVPVLGIAHDFTLQPGVPLLFAQPADGAGTVSLGRFAIDAGSMPAPSWRVPVLAAGPDGQVQRLIVSADHPASLAAPRGVLLNAGQNGYFIARYAPALFAPLVQRFPTLPAQDQLGLLGDTSALASAGQAPMGALLELASALPAQADPTVWSALCGSLTSLGSHYEEGERADTYRRWVRATLAPALARIGWERQPGESDNTTILRGHLLDALSEADHAAVIAQARRRFERMLADPASVAGEERQTALSIVAAHADAGTWERLHARARTAASLLEQGQYLRLLGSARDPALAQRALDLALSGEPPKTLALELVRAVADRHASMAFAFVASHWDAVAALLEPNVVGRFAAQIAAVADDLDTAARLTEFAQRQQALASPVAVRKAVASIRFLAAIKRQRLPEIDRWLSIARYAVTERWPLGGTGGWDYLSFDPIRQRLFVARSDRVEVVDTATGHLAATIAGTEGAHGVAIAEDLKRGYTSNGRSDSVTVFDLDSLAVERTVAVPGHNPDAILYEPRFGRLLTFNGRSKDATVFDARAMTVLASLPMPDKPEFAVTDGDGRVWVNIESDPGQLVLVDSGRMAVQGTWTLEGCDSPTGLALDRARGRLFSTCANGVLVVTDAQSGRQLGRTAIGAGPDAAAFDPLAGIVFSSNGEGTVSVVGEDAAGGYVTLATLATQPGARTLALDAAAHRLFLLSSEFTAPAPASADQPRPRARPVAGTAAVLVMQRRAPAP